MQTQHKVISIVIDGGPCGGKDTIMATLRQEIEKTGTIVINSQETATMLMAGGVAPWTIDTQDFQNCVIAAQLGIESALEAAAKVLSETHGKPCVILYNRGLLDGAAYIPDAKPLEKLDILLRGHGLNVEEARSRYNGIIHLVTAADGAEEFYTNKNNPQRKETAEEARAVDKRTIAAWTGHSHLRIVGNRGWLDEQVSFKEKIQRAVAEAFAIIGYPQPVEIEDKYRLEAFCPSSVLATVEKIDITQTYLVPLEEGAEERLRRRSWLGSSSYYHTVKTKNPGGKGRIEVERLISAREYAKLLERRDPDRHDIDKTRHCFIWRAQYFEVDVFHGRNAGLIILERERTSENDALTLPDFIGAAEDVTDDPQYKNASLAKATL